MASNSYYQSEQCFRDYEEFFITAARTGEPVRIEIPKKSYETLAARSSNALTWWRRRRWKSTLSAFPGHEQLQISRDPVNREVWVSVELKKVVKKPANKRVLEDLLRCCARLKPQDFVDLVNYAKTFIDQGNLPVFTMGNLPVEVLNRFNIEHEDDPIVEIQIDPERLSVEELVKAIEEGKVNGKFERPATEEAIEWWRDNEENFSNVGWVEKDGVITIF